MRVVLQRVSSASVTVDGETVGAIAHGLLLYAGIAIGDDESVASAVAKKCAEMRVFRGADSKFDRSVIDVGGAALVISQFTLLADVRKGRRPSFVAAATPEVAEPLIDAFASSLRSLGVEVAKGRFGAAMEVSSVNDGPVTIVIDSEDLERPRHS